MKLVTFETSQPETSRETRDEQPENMKERLVTFETSQPERSRDFRDEQPKNMLKRLVTFELSQPERSRDFRDEQSENMEEKSEAPETSSFDKSMLLQFARSLNIPSPLETTTLSLVTTDLTRARLSYQGRDEPSHAHLLRTSPCEGSVSAPACRESRPSL